MTDDAVSPLPPPQAAAEQPIEVVLRGAFITLDALLKCTGLAPSGGAAKAMIAAGLVEVDGRHESRRGRKLHAGQRVTVGEARVRVLAAAGPADADASEGAETSSPAAAAPES